MKNEPHDRVSAECQRSIMDELGYVGVHDVHPQPTQRLRVFFLHKQPELQCGRLDKEYHLIIYRIHSPSF